MKKFTTLCLAAAVVGTAFAQQPKSQTKYVAGSAQINKQATLQAKRAQMMNAPANESIVKAYPISSGVPTFSPNGKTAAVSPIALGSANNVYTIMSTDQNQVVADNDLGTVAFIHRNNATAFGGSSGNLRYDISVDGGATFTNDVGPINPLLTRPARYPNVTIHNPAGNTNPSAAKIVGYAATLNSAPDWDGHLAVTADLGSNPPTNNTENYVNLTSGSYIPWSLNAGLPGEYWAMDNEYDGSAFTGLLFVNKGVFNSATNDVDWTRVDTISPNHSLSFDGTPTFVGPAIAFSPDGNTGWIAWLGDLVGGPDSTLQPVLMKSTDGGATWGAPVEFDYASVPWIADTLKTLWVDSLNQPVATGRATAGFDFDLVVDGQGNPHFVTVIGSGATTGNTPGYSIYSGITKFLGDVWSPDGGTTWDVAYISPVLTFRGEFGTGDPVTQDNNVTASRSGNGNVIFYSWVDSDTAAVTGNQTGIGFGVSDNIAPNLRVAARKPYTNEQTYPTLVTDGDLIWEARALFPTMAPVSLLQNGSWNLPIVMAEMPTNDPLAPANFYYFGNDARIANGSNFCFYPSMTLTWDVILAGGGNCAVSNDENVGDENVVLGQSYPNPTNNEAVITFELPAATNVNMTLTNMYGQVVATLANGEMPAGAHKVTVNTRDFAAGVYFYTLEANGVAQTKKMIVSK
jgi:hypothetical protein